MIDIIEILKAILFGIIQGITEWLPISSTGHMILLNELISLKVSNAFWEMFLVVIQFGSILAVIVLFFNRLNPFSRRKNTFEKKQTWSLWFKVVFAIIPSGIVGALFNDWFDEHFYNYIVVAIALFVYGIAFIVIEKYSKGKEPKIQSTNHITYKTAFLIGCAQMLALIPGTSRSGSTILAAMLLGLSRTAAAEFSFFMAIPTMFGASLVKGLKFATDTGVSMSEMEMLILLVGCVVAFLVSLVVIKYLMEFVKKHTFSAFGYYRIILAVVVLLFFGLRNI